MYKKLDVIDINRFRLPVPTNDTSVDEWKLAVENAQAQLQHQETRLINLELLYKYGSDAWKLHNHQLEGSLQHLLHCKTEIENEILEMNKERREAQLEASGNLKSLTSKWMDLILNLRQVESANMELSLKIQSLQKS